MSEQFDSLYRRHAGGVTQMALKEASSLGRPDLAEDASQEAWLRMMRALRQGRYGSERPFAPWAKTIVRRAAIDLARRERPPRRRRRQW